MELNYSVDVTKFNSESRVLSSVKLNQNSSRRSNEVKATIALPRNGSDKAGRFAS